MPSWKQDEVLLLQVILGILVSVGELMSCVVVTKLISIAREVIAVINTNGCVCAILRHMKDQSKKVANLKHNQQLEKKKNAQLLEEVRRREDNMTDNSQHLQVSLFFNCFLKLSKKIHFCSTVCLSECAMNLFPQRADGSFLFYQRVHCSPQLYPWDIYYLGWGKNNRIWRPLHSYYTSNCFFLQLERKVLVYLFYIF